MTHKEELQNMSTSELAFLLAYFSTCDHCVFAEEDCMKEIRANRVSCEEGIAKWLESEVGT